MRQFSSGSTATARPICQEYTEDSRFAYVTMGEGGVVVVELGSADGDTPMSIAHVFPADQVPQIGCAANRHRDGTLLTGGESGQFGGDDFLFVYDTSGNASGIFPAPVQIEVPIEDLHGVDFCETRKGDLYALALGRVSNDIAVINLETYEVEQVWSLDQPWLPDPKPDLGLLKRGKFYITVRGPAPISAIPTLTNPDRIPGVAVVKINRSCEPARFRPKDVASIANPDRTTLLDDEEVTIADPHGIEIVPRERRKRGDDRH